MRSLRWLTIPVVLGAIALGLGACGGGSGASAAKVDASEKEFAISLAQDTIKGGTQQFTVKNAGTTEHEFVIFRTDLDPAKLPTKADSTVDEEGPGVTHVDEIGGIAVGATKSLTVHIQPGHYVVICNLVGHYAQGMRVPLTVQ